MRVKTFDLSHVVNMVQLEGVEMNLVSRSASKVLENAKMGSPYKDRHLGGNCKSAEEKKLISYQMTPKPPPEPLPFPFNVCAICFAGNAKYIVFPLLLAFTLGLFLSFSKAVSLTMKDRGYSGYENGRELSEDDPDFMNNEHFMLGNVAQEPGVLGGRWHREWPVDRRRGAPVAARVAPGAEGGECDCSMCSLDYEINSSPSRFRKLVKHSIQHFYGRQDLVLNIESFVPSKLKRWSLGYALYITASEVCSGEISPLAVVLVVTSHKHDAERKAIRETWGSVARGKIWPNQQLPGEVKVVFLLGVSDDPQDNELATEEGAKYGDIILADFREEEESLTRKVLCGMKWVNMYCPHAKYLVKINEDTFFDLPRLLYLISSQDMSNIIYGPIKFSELVKRQSRDNSKAVSRDNYAPNYFPPYTEGTFYVMHTDLSKKITGVAEYIPYLGREDVFITGILAKVFDVRHLNIPNRLFDRTGQHKIGLCDFITGQRLVQQDVTPKMARELWLQFENKTLCKHFKQ